MNFIKPYKKKTINLMSFITIVLSSIVIPTMAFADEAPSPHQYSTGLITNYYQYRETVRGINFMSDKGYMVGGIFNYTYTTENKYFVGADMDFSCGRANYNSNGTGSLKNIKQCKQEARLKFGRNFLNSNNTSLSPYTGLGVRHKSDYTSGTKTSTGHYGYDRHSTYLYLPIGLKIGNTFSKVWAMESFGEFDVLLTGRQQSKLPMMTLKHKQTSGYGIRGAVEFIKSLSNNKAISFGPFVNYWNINDSNTIVKRYRGKLMSSCEPHNTTIEAGFCIKYRF